MQAAPHEAVMVGDSLPHDIAGALGLGHAGGARLAFGRQSRATCPTSAGHPLAARAAGVALMLLMQIRPLTTLEDCRQVAALERTVWGYTDAEDVVPPPVLIVSIKRGGILLGAFDDGGAMKGFVYSMPAIKDGRPTQWSHMLGVMPRDARGRPRRAAEAGAASGARCRWGST